jgi:hypothetical protein
VMVFISIADPDPHSICPLNPDPASECGSASSYLNIGAKSLNLLCTRKFSETITYKW